MVPVYIAVGSNLGDRQVHIDTASRDLRAREGVQDFRTSALYETDPVGGPPQGKFLNGVWEFRTAWSVRALFETLQGIESALGRKRDGRNQPRPIDLDILFYGDYVVQEEDLRIPHPRLCERRFVLQPMNDLAPDWIHPQSGKSMRELLEELS